MEKKDIRVYLAGPMTNCNDHQRRTWRKDIKRELKRRGYGVLDPTENTARKGAFAVTADVDEADVVIANLWKESIGTVLVEAKAYDLEERPEGKSPGNDENHQQIHSVISEANLALNDICPGWAITRDSHYQLCNRFAWAWKVASLGVPVILVYLGFLHANEMSRCGKPFSSDREWRSLMLDHSHKFVPDVAWESSLQTGGAPMWAMIRTLDLKWDAARSTF